MTGAGNDAYGAAMRARPPQIVAFGGGGFSMEWGNTLLDDYMLELTGAQRPRVCFLPTASGDADHYVVRFYKAFSAARCEPSGVLGGAGELGPEVPRGVSEMRELRAGRRRWD